MVDTSSGSMPDNDIEDAPSVSAFILGSKNWEERLSKARAQREEALTSRKDHNPENISSTATAAGENVPSIDEILTTANWSDRLEKATARRHEIIGNSKPERGAAVVQPLSFGQPFKDVVLGAMGGQTAAPVNSSTGEAVKINLPALITGDTTTDGQKRRIALLPLLTAAAFVLMIGLIIPGPFRDLASGALNRVGDVAPIAQSPFSADVQPSSAAIQHSSPQAVAVKPPANADSGNLTLSTVPQTTVEIIQAPKYSIDVLPLALGETTEINLSRTAPTGPAPASGVEQLASIPAIIATTPVTNALTSTKTLPSLPSIAAGVAGYSPMVTISTSSFLPATVPNAVLLFTQPDTLPRNVASTFAANTARATIEMPAFGKPQNDILNVAAPELFLHTSEPKLVPLVIASAQPEQFIPHQDTPAPYNAAAALGGADQFHIQIHAPVSLADDQLAQITKSLAGTGFEVGEPKRIGLTISKNNVRYFNASDAEAAQVLAAAIGGKARNFTNLRPSPPSGTIEVWLAGKAPKRATTRRSTNRVRAPETALSALRRKLLKSLQQGEYK